MAQLGSRATTISRFVQDLAPLMQIDPTCVDAIDLDKTVQTLAIARGVPRTMLRSAQDIQQMRQQKQKQQQLQQAAQTAEPISKSMKNLADASAKSPGGNIQNLLPAQ